MDRELFARNIINIIDVKNCYQFKIFMNDDLEKQLIKYLNKLISDPGNDINIFIAKHEQTINKVVKNIKIDILEHNNFMNDLKKLKKKYLM